MLDADINVLKKCLNLVYDRVFTHICLSYISLLLVVGVAWKREREGETRERKSEITRVFVKETTLI